MKLAAKWLALLLLSGIAAAEQLSVLSFMILKDYNGKPIRNASVIMHPVKGNGKQVPASSPLSERVAKELKRRGFKFVGPTIVYAWMQAVGIVNDHAATCFRRRQV